MKNFKAFYNWVWYDIHKDTRPVREIEEYFEACLRFEQVSLLGSRTSLTIPATRNLSSQNYILSEVFYLTACRLKYGKKVL